MNPEDYTWAGIGYPEDVQTEVAFVTPLAYYVEGLWKSLSLNARRQWFLNNGKAAVFQRDFPSSKICRLCQFRPTRNTELIPPNGRGYSYYLVSGDLEPAPLAQIID